MSKLLLLLLFLSCAPVLIAQPIDSLLRQEIGINPAALAHPIFPFLEGSYVRPLNERQSFAFLVGVPLRMGYAQQGGLDALYGFRLRGVWRIYEPDLVLYGEGNYWEVGPFYRYLDTRWRGDFGRSNNQFRQRLTYRVRQHTAGIYGGYGQQVVVGNGPVYFDWAIGLAVGRRFWTPDDSLPEDVSQDDLLENGTFNTWLRPFDELGYFMNVPLRLGLTWTW